MMSIQRLLAMWLLVAAKVCGSPQHDDVGESAYFYLEDQVYRSQNDRVLSGTKRILCYGDSLTAGWPGDCPYATSLQKALNEGNNENTFQVDFIGIPGRRTDQFVELRYETHGFATALEEQPADLVIFLAGTGNIPQSIDEDNPILRQNFINEKARSITHDLKHMHTLALAAGAAHTIALGIPDSEWQQQEPGSAEIAEKVNRHMKVYFHGNRKTTFVDFPIEYASPPSVDWEDDLHLTCEGYDTLGRALAPTVLSILS